MADDFKLDITREFKSPTEEGLPNDINYGGKTETGLESLLKTETIFGKIGNKHTIDEAFDNLYSDKVFAGETSLFDEPEIDPSTGRPYDDDTWEEKIFNDREQRVEAAKQAPISEEQLQSLEDESDFVKLQMADGEPISSYDFEKRRFYLNELERQKESAHANTDWVDYGALLIASIGDADSLATMGAGSIFKATKVGSKVFTEMGKHKVSSGAFIGAAYAGGNTLALNAVDDTGVDGDVMMSTAFGGVLGGSLGWMGHLISNRKAGSNVIDPTTNKPITKGEALVNAIKEKELEIAKFDEMAEANLKIHAEAKISSEDIVKGSERYRRKVQKLQLEKQELELQLGVDGKIDTDIKAMSKQLEDDFETSTISYNNFLTKAKQLRDKLVAQIAKKEETIEGIKARTKFDKELTKVSAKSTKATKAITEANAALKTAKAEYKASLKKGSEKAKVAALKRFNKATEKLAKVKADSDALKKTVNQLRKERPEYVKSNKGLATLKEDKALLKKMDADNKKTIKERDNLQGKLAEDKEALGSLKADEMHKVKSKLAEVQKRLAAISMKSQDLTGKRVKAEAELEKLKAGELPDTYKAELLSAKDKLQQELDEYLENPMSMDRLQENPMFNIAPSFLQKFVISPVERLYASNNPAIRSLATLLSPPVIAKEGFVNNMTARTFIRDAKNNASDTLMAIEREFVAYKKAGGTEFDRGTWFQHVSKERARLIGEQQRANVARVPNEDVGGKLYNDILEEMHMTASYKFTHGNPQIAKSMQLMEDYYKGVKTQGTDLRVEGIAGARNEGYVHQLYDEGAARALGQEKFVDGLVRAQSRYALDHGLPDDIDLFRAKAEKAHYMALSENQRYEKMYNMFNPKHTGTSPLHQKSIMMYADDAAMFVNHNTPVNMVTYARGMGGRFALKKFLGINNKAELKPKLQQLGKMEESEVKSIDAIVDTIAGYREVARYEKGWEEYLHGASTVSSMLHTMNFGISATTEITTVVANSGFKSTLKNMIPSFKMVKNVYKNGGTEADFKRFSAMKDVGQYKFGTEVNRMEMGEDFDRLGSFQDSMDNIVHKESVWSGLQFFTDWFKVNAQMASQDFITDMARDITKISKADRKRLSQMGISDEHLQVIREKAFDKSGKYVGNRDQWGDELNDIIDRGSLNQAYGSVLHPDGFTLPMMMTDGSNQFSRTANNSILKFMKFPIASYEALLLQGISTFDAKIMVGTALNLGMWSQIILAKDALNNWGDTSKNKYDLDQEEGWAKLLQDTLMVMSVTGSISSVGNIGSSVLFGESITGYQKGVGDNTVVSDIQRGLRGDIPMSLYGVQLMKTLENLDLVGASYETDMVYKKGYNIGE